MSRSRVGMPKITRTDARLITPHLDGWNEIITRIPPDTVLSRDEMTNLMASDHVEGPYRDQFMGALIRYSVARGDLVKLGSKDYVRIGVSRESVIALSQHVALSGLFVVEDSPGTFLGYEDLAWEDGRRERNYVAFARNVGDIFRWTICSVPITVPLDGNDQPMWDDRTRGFLAKRLEHLMLM